VEEAKAGLEAQGHRVFYGLDIRTTADEGWRKQWCIECEKADFVINFLSAAYIRSQSCAEEWHFSKNKKDAASVINLLVGGRDAREELMAVPTGEVANKGGMAIHMHFDTGGQAVSVYGADDITAKILAQVVHNPEPQIAGSLPSEEWPQGPSRSHQHPVAPAMKPADGYGMATSLMASVTGCDLACFRNPHCLPRCSPADGCGVRTQIRHDGRRADGRLRHSPGRAH
jgi:hypothetical protein